MAEIKIINLEENLPFVSEALDILRVELQIMRADKEKWAVVIHGFGKRTQGGGKIKEEARLFLQAEKSKGGLSTVIYGENFDLFSAQGLSLISRFPNLKPFVMSKNLGITIIEM